MIGMKILDSSSIMEYTARINLIPFMCEVSKAVSAHPNFLENESQRCELRGIRDLTHPIVKNSSDDLLPANYHKNVPSLRFVNGPSIKGKF